MTVAEYFVPSFAGTVRVQSERMPDDPGAAVAFTIRRMTQYATEDARSPIVQAAVRDACPARGSVVDVCRCIYSWARSHVRFEPDDVKSEGAGFGSGNEVLVRPVDLLRMADPSEDCDGYSMLVVSMLLAARRLFGLDIRPSFCTLATRADAPTEFTHVYVFADVPGAGFALDASHGPSFGWEQPNRFRKRKLWPVGESMFQNVNPPARLGRPRVSVVTAGKRLGDALPYDPGADAAVAAWANANEAALDSTILNNSFDYFPSLSSNAGSSSGTPGWVSALIPSLVNAGTVLGVSALAPSGAKVQTNAAGQLGLSLPSNFSQSLGSLLPLVLVGGLAVVVIKAIK